MRTFEHKANDFPLFSTTQQSLKSHLNKPKRSLCITPCFIVVMFDFIPQFGDTDCQRYFMCLEMSKMIRLFWNHVNLPNVLLLASIISCLIRVKVSYNKQFNFFNHIYVVQNNELAEITLMFKNFKVTYAKERYIQFIDTLIVYVEVNIGEYEELKVLQV